MGRKAVQFIGRTKRNLTADFALKDAVHFADIRPIAKFVSDKFISGEVDQVRVLYPKFVNTLTQQSVMRILLPVPAEELDVEGEANRRRVLVRARRECRSGRDTPSLYRVSVFQMALNARASEHSARMVAMKNATDNAKELIKDLTLEYNKVRQANITTELLEITTAQLAVG